MEQSFFQKLKRVKLSDLMHLFKLLLAIPIALIMRITRKNLWLLCDTRYEAADNAFWLFKYICENEPQTDVCFAIDKKSPDYAKVAALGKTVHYGSLMHWVYYLVADKNVSSQKMGKPNAAICYVLEVYGILKNKRAFLQHGVITADLTFLHYQHTKMKLFVTSTYDEWKYVNDVYEYPEGYVQELGLCRFDGLHDFTVKRKQLLVMPTWRMYIRNEITSSDKNAALEEFKATEYFRNWNELLTNEQFVTFIEKNNIEVVFYPHREMGAYLDGFHLKSSNIRMLSFKECDVQTLLKESAFLITDYSSVSMDFAYMKKPLIYFQFDYEQFRTGHHPEGYFSFKEDGFGPVCENADMVVKAIQDAYDEEAGFINPEQYLQRHGQYFDLYDTNNCQRNYEAIAKM